MALSYFFRFLADLVNSIIYVIAYNYYILFRIKNISAFDFIWHMLQRPVVENISINDNTLIFYMAGCLPYWYSILQLYFF